jgi:hypothetical protein
MSKCAKRYISESSINVSLSILISLKCCHLPMDLHGAKTQKNEWHHKPDILHTLTHLSGRSEALSSWPGASMWMKIDLSLISHMQGWFTKSWNDESEIQNASEINYKMVTHTQLISTMSQLCLTTINGMQELNYTNRMHYTVLTITPQVMYCKEDCFLPLLVEITLQK